MQFQILDKWKLDIIECQIKQDFDVRILLLEKKEKKRSSGFVVDVHRSIDIL